MNRPRLVGRPLIVGCLLAVSAGMALGQATQSTYSDANKEFARQLGEVEERFPMVAKSLSHLQSLQRLCNVDQACFDTAQALCLQSDLPPKFCFESSRDACCKPLVVFPGATPPASPSVTTDIADLAGIHVLDMSVGEEPADCAEPRPADIGCGAICKPCVSSVCIDGEWERVEIIPPEELCAPRGPMDPPFNACPRTPDSFCPAECHICF